MTGLAERYSDRIAGEISCFDRVVISGSLPQICYPGGMAAYLSAKGSRLFELPKFAWVGVIR